MAMDDDWCASALALTEVLVLVERVGTFEGERNTLRRAVRDDWERFHVVPVDRHVSTAPRNWAAPIPCVSSTRSTSPQPTGFRVR